VALCDAPASSSRGVYKLSESRLKTKVIWKIFDNNFWGEGFNNVDL